MSSDSPSPVERRVASNRSGAAIAILLACIAAILLAGLVLEWTARNMGASFPTTYQAVLLSNGAVYYGKLQGYGTPHPLLKDVYYIVSHTDANTHQTSNVLVKRGKEPHGPDRMYLNPSQIVFVETVGNSSKVADLISQAH